MKLAQALLRRKELQNKVDQLKPILNKDIFETITERRQITQSVDDITARVPKLDANQVTKEYDYYSRQLRHVDAAIQQTNWTTEIELEIDVMKNYTEQGGLSPVNEVIKGEKAEACTFALKTQEKAFSVCTYLAQAIPTMELEVNGSNPFNHYKWLQLSGRA